MKRSCKYNDHSQRGFTMIEMIIVLIVMAIIGSYVLVRATPGSNDLIAQTEILKSHLRYAQIRAMNDDVPWGIHIPSGGASYILYRNNAQAQATYLLPGENAQTHTFPAAVTVTAGAGTTVNFNNWGSPGTTTLTITLTQGTDTGDITVTKNTGYIP